jgi:hypothetical protein
MLKTKIKLGLIAFLAIFHLGAFIFSYYLKNQTDLTVLLKVHDKLGLLVFLSLIALMVFAAAWGMEFLSARGYQSKVKELEAKMVDLKAKLYDQNEEKVKTTEEGKKQA